ncbi:MAG: hypothetical protein ACYCZX_08155 [Rhodospirillaceae bacterium]
MNHPFITAIAAGRQSGKGAWATVADAFAACLQPENTPEQRLGELARIEAAVDETVFPAGSLRTISAIMQQLQILKLQAVETPPAAIGPAAHRIPRLRRESSCLSVIKFGKPR